MLVYHYKWETRVETPTTWVFVGNETSFLTSARSSKATVMHMTWSWRTWSLPSLPVLSALCPWPTTPWSCVWEWSSTAVNGSVSHDTQSGTWNFNQTIFLHYTLYSNMMWANTESAECSFWPACFRWPDVLQHSRWTPNDLQRPGCLLQWLCVRWSISWKVWV